MWNTFQSSSLICLVITKHIATRRKNNKNVASVSKLDNQFVRFNYSFTLYRAFRYILQV